MPYEPPPHLAALSLSEIAALAEARQMTGRDDAGAHFLDQEA